MTAEATREIARRIAWYHAQYYGHARADESAPLHSGWWNGEAQLAAYHEHLRLVSGSRRILDLGCGDGALLEYLLKNSPTPIEPYGVDFLPQSIAIARARMPAHTGNLACAEISAFVGSLSERFDAIVTSPDYVLPTAQENFIHACASLLNVRGKLVLYLYKGDPHGDCLLTDWKRLATSLPVSVMQHDGVLVRAIVVTREPRVEREDG